MGRRLPVSPALAAAALAFALALLASAPAPAAAAPYQVVVNTLRSAVVQGGGANVVVVQPKPRVTVRCSPAPGLVCQSHVRGNQVIVHVFHDPGVIYNIYRSDQNGVKTEVPTGDATETPETSEVGSDEDNQGRELEVGNESREEAEGKEKGEEEEEKEDENGERYLPEEPEDPSSTVDDFDSFRSTGKQPDRVRESSTETYGHSADNDDNDSGIVRNSYLREAPDEADEEKHESEERLFGSESDDAQENSRVAWVTTTIRDVEEEDGDANAESANGDATGEKRSNPPSAENETDDDAPSNLSEGKADKNSEEEEEYEEENNEDQRDDIVVEEISSDSGGDTAVIDITSDEREPTSVNSREDFETVEATTKNELLTGKWWPMWT